MSSGVEGAEQPADEPGGTRREEAADEEHEEGGRRERELDVEEGDIADRASRQRSSLTHELEQERDDQHHEGDEDERPAAEDAGECGEVTAHIRELERGSPRRDRRRCDELILELHRVGLDALGLAMAPSSLGATGVLGAGHVASCLRVP